MASGQTFESDLRAIREARGLPLSEIHQLTRIPVDVLRRFEDGALLNDPTFNEVYLKAFMQSYAKAVGIPASVVLVAYEDQRAGAYRGALHPDSKDDLPPVSPPPASASATPPAEAPQAEASGKEAANGPAAPSAKAPPAKEPAAKAPPAKAPAAKAPPARQAPAEEASATPPAAPAKPSTNAPPAVAALREVPDPEKARAAAPPPKTLAEARVNRPAVPSANRSFDKNWTTILGLFVVVLVLIASALYVLVFADDGPEPEDTVAVADGTGSDAADSAATPPPPPAGGPELRLPMRVVLTAGGDGLQSFRVTVDDEGRRPYWIEVGNSETFEADSLLILWGEDPSGDFSEATVEFQGLRFTPTSGRELTLTPRTAQGLLDSLATATPTP